jgi:hypothetical protein
MGNMLFIYLPLFVAAVSILFAGVSAGIGGFGHKVEIAVYSTAMLSLLTLIVAALTISA